MFFLISGAFLAACWVATRKIHLLVKAAGVLGLMGAVAFGVWVFHIPVRDLGTPWYESTPYKHLIALTIMILGMLAKYLFDAIESRRRNANASQAAGRLNLDRWDFFQPTLLSLVIFGTFWQVHGGETLSVEWTVICF